MKTKINLADQNNLLSKPKAEVAAATANLGAEPWGKEKSCRSFHAYKDKLTGHTTTNSPA